MKKAPILLKRYLSVLICIIIALSMLGCASGEPEAVPDISQSETTAGIEENPITVIACSDFQNPGGNDAGADTVEKILTKIKEDYPDADGLICAGDYDYDMTLYIGEGETQSGIQALKNAVKSVYSDISNEVFIAGNHDVYSAADIAKSGPNDPDNGGYGVFAINEDDYMWCSNAGYSESYSSNNPLEIISDTAERLKEYLDSKASESFTNPIFIVSHLPLHYSMRTRNDGDGMYSNYIFDVINEAGELGLNIIYLYGHDHSNGWDDYLGGSAVFLKKGDSINIAQSSKFAFETETLTFTYMNAGYVGYYENHNGGDDALTMSVFNIYKDRVEISRYDENGLHNLKSLGVHNSYKGETDYDYPVDKSLVTGIYTLELNMSINASDDYSGESETAAMPPEEASDVPSDESISAENAVYVKISAPSDELEEGQYLIVYNGTELMSGNVVSKNGSSGERIGFELVAYEYAGHDWISADLSEYEWTITRSQSNGKWLIGNQKGYIKLTNTTDKAITASLEEVGDEFTISGAGTYNFFSPEYVLNYNSRGLINGYANLPADFDLYIKK